MLMLTEGLWWPELRRRRSSAKSGGGMWRSSRRKAESGSLRAPRLLGSARGPPGVEARPLCCSGGAGEQQSNAAAAEQRRGEAELRRSGG